MDGSERRVVARRRRRRERAIKSEEITFAEQRHAALLRALDLPSWTVGVGFGYLERGEHFELPNRQRRD